MSGGESVGTAKVGAAVKVCARCGDSGDVQLSDVVSGNFLDRDRLPFRSESFCAPCAALFTDRSLRQLPSELTGTRRRVLSAIELHAALARPMDGQRAVCVPLAGRKHLVPWLRWETVLSDHVEMHWRDRECELLARVVALRSAGYGEGALRESAPRQIILRSCDDVASVLDDWAALRRWRDDGAIEIAIRATRRPKEAVA